MTSQADMVLLYLQSGRELTPLEALNLFGCFRLAARVKDLRAKGYPIETVERTENGKHFAAYRLPLPCQTSFDLTVPASLWESVPAVERARSSSFRATSDL